MIDFFLDPVLRGPTWGCTFMAIASSLMGVCLFLRKRSLLSESLSHAAYPGAVLGVLLFAFFFPGYQQWTFIGCLLGAFFSSIIGLKSVNLLEKKSAVKSDAALCFVLAVFFGVGVVLASFLQAKFPAWKNQVQALLLGQAATMGDHHIYIYGSFSLIIAFFLFLVFRPLQALLFDPNFTKLAKIQIKTLESILFFLIVLSLVVGIRSVGVVLISGMTIAPSVAARAFTDKLQNMFFLASFFGALSGIFGNYFSLHLSIPTGPAIVLVGAFITFASLLFAPKKGIVFRLLRIYAFKLRCLEENILKAIWKKGRCAGAPKFIIWKLKRQGWLDQSLALTVDGSIKAASIVRLHRLWELYLTEFLGENAEKVHRTAEEMEHILTPELERELTKILLNPTKDPHQQPIPGSKYYD